MSAAAATATASTSTFFQHLTREEAEAALRERPMHPILRPCSYTPCNPRIHAITYRGSLSTPIRHSLVELDPSGCVYEIEVQEGEFVRGRVHDSVQTLETFVRQTSRRLWLHTSSIRTEPVAVSSSHMYMDFQTAMSTATHHHSTANLFTDMESLRSTAVAYYSTAHMYAAMGDVMGREEEERKQDEMLR